MRLEKYNVTGTTMKVETKSRILYAEISWMLVIAPRRGCFHEVAEQFVCTQRDRKQVVWEIIKLKAEETA
jgi:hypothetical protein